MIIAIIHVFVIVHIFTDCDAQDLGVIITSASDPVTYTNRWTSGACIRLLPVPIYYTHGPFRKMGPCYSWFEPESEKVLWMTRLLYRGIRTWVGSNHWYWHPGYNSRARTDTTWNDRANRQGRRSMFLIGGSRVRKISNFSANSARKVAK